MTTLDAIGLVIELLSWIGLCTGIPLLLLGMLRRSTAATWRPTAAVVVDDRLASPPVDVSSPQAAADPLPTGPSGSAHADASSRPVLLRWFGDDGEVHSAVIGPGHTISPGPDDDVTVYVNANRPDQIHLHQPTAPGRAFSLSGWILTGVGIAALAASLVLSAI